MGCCGAATRIHTARVNGKVLVPPGEEDKFNGPIHNRVCRDVVFLILFIALVIGAIAFVWYVYHESDPERLVHGNDKYGNVCGRRNKKIDGIPESGQDFVNRPYFTFGLSFTATDFAVQGRARVVGNCTSSCQNQTTLIGYLCIPTIARDVVNYTDEALSSMYTGTFTSFFEQVSLDLQRSWQYILILCAIAVALAFILTLLMRFIAWVVVYICIFVMVVGTIGGTIYLWVTWHLKKTKLEEEKENMSELEKNVGERLVRYFMIAAVVATIFTVIVLIILIALRKRIMLVVALFQEAGKAVGAMPFLLIHPIWTFIWLTVICLVWLLGWILMEATGEPQEYEGSVYYIKTNFMAGMRWYHIFAFLWITQFVLACQDITIAGAVAQWFFTRNKKKDLGWPILTSMKRMYRYHLGSIALGSLIIAIVKLVRYLLKSLEKRLNNSGNQCCACMLKCCRCCLWCFEKFIKFLNKNAYIEIAIYGYGFCKAAQKAFTLLVSNVLRVAAINSVGTFVLFLIKMSIVALTILIGFYMFQDRTDLKYFYVPLIIAAIFSYFIAHCFISVFEMTIDTLFLCFCEDCERNDGIAKPYFMSKGLMKFVENSRKAMEALDEREKIEKNNNNNNNNNNKNGQSWATTVQPVGAGNPNAPPRSPAVRGLTPLQPAYPPTSVPPSPSHFLSPNT